MLFQLPFENSFKNIPAAAADLVKNGQKITMDVGRSTGSARLASFQAPLRFRPAGRFGVRGHPTLLKKCQEPLDGGQKD